MNRLNRTPVMYSPDLAMGIGSLAYALCKLEGKLHPEEMQTVRSLFAAEPYGDLAVCACFLRDTIGEPVDEAYAFGLRRMVDKRVELTRHTKQRFISILLRVARSHEGISRQEREFIRQFWRELRQL